MIIRILSVLALALASVAANATIIKAEATLSAANTCSAQVPITNGFNFSLSSTWVATVTLQRSFDNGVSFLDVTNYTANIQDRGNEPETGVVYRFCIKPGNYTSGSVAGRISQ